MATPNPFYRPCAPRRAPAHHTVKHETIDLTDLDDSGSDEWDFEGVSSDSSPEPITISSDSDSSVEAIVVTKHVKTRIKQFRKTRPKHDSCPDDEDLPAKAERFARTVFRKAESFIDNEAGHSGADNNSGDSDDTGYVSNLINDSPSSSEPDFPSPVAHVAPTSKQRGEHARNAAENAINVIIPALQPQKRPSVVKLTWCDPKSNKIRSKRCRCYDDISDESDGQARYAYVPYVPDEPQVSLSPRELKRKRTQRALAAHKKARAARKQR